MSSKAVISGQYNLVDESSNTNILSFNLADIFPQITGIREFTAAEMQLVDTDGAVSIPTAGVTTIKGILVYVVGGTDNITIKHDSNTNGIVGKAVLIHGTISTITVETAATQAITVKYLLFE